MICCLEQINIRGQWDPQRELFPLPEDFKYGLLESGRLSGGLIVHRNACLAILPCRECSQCASLFWLYALFLEPVLLLEN